MDVMDARHRTSLFFPFVAGAALLSLTGALAGCGAFFITREDGNLMQQEIDKLKAKSSKLDQQAADLRKATEEAGSQMKKLVDDATKVVTRNSANLGQDVDKLKIDLAAISQRMTSLEERSTQSEQRIDGLSKSFDTFRGSTDVAIEKINNATTTSKTPPIPETADGVYAEAKKRYDAKQWIDARRLFDAFIARYGADIRASTAQYLIGEAYYAEAKYANAIGAYSKVIDLFPKAESVPDAMFKNGLAFKALKYCGDARIYFQELLKRYPRTEWKKDAGDELKKILRDVKNKDACTS